MIQKDKYLLKRLIREAIIIAAIVVAALVGAAVLANYNEDTQSDTQQKQNENNKLRAEKNATEQQLSTQLEVSAYYDSYIKNHNSDFTLNREAATSLLANLREKHHLASLGVTISPLTELATDMVKLKTGTMVKSQVTLNFTALTDNSIYGFIEALQRQFPGLVVVDELKFTRTEELSRATLMDLGQHKLTPLVSGDLSFAWLGIRTKPEDKPAAAGVEHEK